MAEASRARISSPSKAWGQVVQRLEHAGVLGKAGLWGVSRVITRSSKGGGRKVRVRTGDAKRKAELE